MGKVSPAKAPKMANVIALDSKNQSAFTKAIRKVGKSMKAKKLEGEEKHQRGIILVSHLPYGFFEQALKGFFSQFGGIRRIRLARSPKTGRSKGFAFIEFEYREVAEIAAESMNNYLMYERIIKCKVLDEPDLDTKKIFAARYIRKNSCPTLHRRRKLIKDLAAPMETEEIQKQLEARVKKIARNNKKLEALGISYKYEDITDEQEVIAKNQEDFAIPVKLSPAIAKFKLSPTSKGKKKKSFSKAQRSATSTPVPPSPSSKSKLSPKLKQSISGQESTTGTPVSASPTAKSKTSPKPKRKQSISGHEPATASPVSASPTAKPKSPKLTAKLSISGQERATTTPVSVSPTPNSKFSPKLKAKKSISAQESVISTPVSASPTAKSKSSPKLKAKQNISGHESATATLVSASPTGNSKSSPKFKPKKSISGQESATAPPVSASPTVKSKPSPKVKGKKSVSQAQESSGTTPAPPQPPLKSKFSPKFLRSTARKSVAPLEVDESVDQLEQVGPSPKKTKFSPKLLRSHSRKSDAISELPKLPLKKSAASRRKSVK